MKPEFSIYDLISNLVDELERTNALIEDLRNGEIEKYGDYEELATDIEADLERYYDNLDTVKTVTETKPL